ncbi:DUF6994 family protein [Acetobacterium malicum]|uniref:DUF6994 family protein n=1 Tax=Acetobacterium malicum TaxID=52692 RepID=UPI0003F7ACD0|nr:hypothetical protein [Acetobacterium dehalogenans]
MTIKYTFQRNIEFIRLLYDSELCDRLSKGKRNFAALKPVIESIYKDPDVNDRSLFIDNSRFNGFELGLDGLCGWKILFDIHKGEKQWLEDYEKIRGSKLGYLIWPNSTDKRKHPTINQERYRVFGDRIDYTLYDIGLFLSKNESECRLSNSYVGQTADFLKEFKGIKEFAEEMKLEVFLKDEKVINLDCLDDEDEKKRILTLEQHKTFSFSPRLGTDRKIEKFSLYIKNIAKICEESEAKLIR